MKTSKPALGLGLAALLAAALPAEAQLFKCQTKEGKTLYQDQPCETTSKQSTLRGAPPPAPAPPPEDPKEKEKEKDGGVPDKPIPQLTLDAIEVVVGFAMCAEKVPGFTEGYNSHYEAWKRRNQSQMERMNNRQEARWLNERLRIERTRTEGFEGRCDAFGQQLAESAKAAAQAAAPKQ